MQSTGPVIKRENLLAVLNPGGRDPNRSFPSGAGQPRDLGHPPVNSHAYAACTGGGFYRKAGDIPAATRAVLVLLRRNGLPEALRAVRRLKSSGKCVLISWKESGLHQVANALADVGRHGLFQTLCREADGFISSTPDLVPLYAAAGACRGAFVPTPYPVDSAAWDFSRNLAERAGIFVGTREFSVPSRNHLLAVTLACTLGPVTVVNPDGKSGERLLRGISPAIRIVTGPLPYPKYLGLLAEHRVVFQLDRSAVPGQVAGDALLARMPCVGGDGAVDRLAYGDCFRGDAVEACRELLADDAAWHRAVERSQQAAREHLSFGVVAERLEKFLREA